MNRGFFEHIRFSLCSEVDKMLEQKSYIFRVIFFLVINFGALALGGLLQGKGAFTGWYADLNKAPWTPPGWVFGAAWFTIMFCFSFYMASLTGKGSKLVLVLFAIQFLLNVSWNPIFFKFHQVLLGLIVITTLTVLMAFFGIKYWSDLKLKSLLVLPYVIWLCIATSLNAYILFKNPV